MSKINQMKREIEKDINSIKEVLNKEIIVIKFFSRYQIQILNEKNEVILINFSKFKKIKEPYFIRLQVTIKLLQTDIQISP